MGLRDIKGDLSFRELLHHPGLLSECPFFIKNIASGMDQDPGFRSHLSWPLKTGQGI
jgi:hypothetical protein